MWSIVLMVSPNQDCQRTTHHTPHETTMIDIHTISRIVAVYGFSVRINLTSADIFKGSEFAGTVDLYGNGVQLDAVRSICMPN